jgi:hypothetical protein
MSVSNRIPQQSRFIATSNIFSAAFNTPVVGKYSFDVAANERQIVIPLQSNTVYLLDRLSFSGTIPQETYFSAIDTLPTITFRYRIGNEVVYMRSIPLIQYSDGKESAAWLLTNKGGEDLVITLRGVLNQTADMVGVDPVKLNVGCEIYAVDEKIYNATFRDATPGTFAESVMRK